jgi:hypothetical protein
MLSENDLMFSGNLMINISTTKRPALSRKKFSWPIDSYGGCISPDLSSVQTASGSKLLVMNYSLLCSLANVEKMALPTLTPKDFFQGVFGEHCEKLTI